MHYPVKDYQQFIHSLGVVTNLKIDNLLGKNTLAALDTTLKAKGVDKTGRWTDERKFVALEQVYYNTLGIDSGTVDGLVGPQTLYARDRFTALPGSEDPNWRDNILLPPETLKPEDPSLKWPKQKDVISFFGEPGTNLARMELPFRHFLAWDLSETVSSTLVNVKVMDAMYTIWENTLNEYGLAEIDKLRLNRFGGCFNKRKMRGGSSWSMHAFGIAWDVDPERNQLKWGKDRAFLDAKEYEPFWKIVEAQGAISLGRKANYDWMHFQFARI